jgi:phage-related baseplate assembly protein
MPANYGTVSKAYISQEISKNPQQTVSFTQNNNPLTLDLYILSYNSNKQLTQASDTLKNNLVTYINQYRMVTDAINIRDAYYINIGINFDITILSGYSNKDVLTNCVSILKDYFNIDKWQINQPIVLSDITSNLLQVRGVQSVVKLEIINKQDSTGNTYSQYGYDIAGATRQGNIYPSVDPAVFEVRYPNTDIQGRVVVQ